MKDNEDSEISFSVANQKYEEEPSEVSTAIPYKSLEYNLEENSNKSTNKWIRLKKEDHIRFVEKCLSYLYFIQFLILNLFNLLNSAKQKFEDEETGDDLTLLLNDDKTKVDDERYFQTLADNIVFVIVHANEPYLNIYISIFLIMINVNKK